MSEPHQVSEPKLPVPAQTRCRHCQMVKELHADHTKCLFGMTSYDELVCPTCDGFIFGDDLIITRDDVTSHRYCTVPITGSPRSDGIWEPDE